MFVFIRPICQRSPLPLNFGGLQGGQTGSILNRATMNSILIEQAIRLRDKRLWLPIFDAEYARLLREEADDDIVTPLDAYLALCAMVRRVAEQVVISITVRHPRKGHTGRRKWRRRVQLEVNKAWTAEDIDTAIHLLDEVRVRRQREEAGCCIDVEEQDARETHAAVLGVHMDAPLAVIQRAYREKALRLHPDKAGQQSTEAFQQLTEAYEALRENAR